MPAIRLKCHFCTKTFWASRKDSKWCSERCRYYNRQEDARFNMLNIPKSGVTGVTYSRIRKNWHVTIRDGKGRKYVGSFRSLKKAVAFQLECQA